VPVQVNGRYLLQRITGQQRYAREIISRWNGRCRVIRPAAGMNGPPGHLWEQTVLPLRKGRGVLWSPSTTGPIAVGEQVVTIHDCAFFDQAACFSRAFTAWYQYLVPRLARRVRRIITVSEFSRQRIVDCCRVSPQRVEVIHSGVDSRFSRPAEAVIAAAKSRLNLPERYVLCVGSLEPRKNLRGLLAAWQLVAPQAEGLSLVLAGAKGKVFRDAGLTHLPPSVHLAGYVDDESLASVYAGAELFIYPSLYEGFGLPVLEAMACGTPVICSNTTALPEVAGDAAALVDPRDVDDIATRVFALVNSQTARQRLREAGCQRAALFNWDTAAVATWRVLQEAAA
jgi:glycosyltransferase involved in cell wall biosynthesis